MTDELEDMLRLLGNPTRFRIARRLSLGPTYFLDLVRLSESGPQAVARHLDLMERAGVIRTWGEETSNKRFFGLAKNIRIAIDIQSGELKCETERISREQRERSAKSITSLGAAEELRRIEGEMGLLERRLSLIRKRRAKLLREYRGKP